MKKVIFRVDDRLIHGQVIEGWVKYYKINHVVVVCDRMVDDPLHRMIYETSLPPGTELDLVSLDEFVSSFHPENYNKGVHLILFESVDDLYKCKELISNDVYLNIGCVASREHKIEVSDTVFLNNDEISKACRIRESYEIFIHKVPWEPSVEIMGFSKLIEGDL